MKNQNKYMTSVLYVLIVIVFGFIFVQGIITQPIPNDTLGWWWATLWSIFAIGFGTYWAINSDYGVELNKRYFQWLYSKTGFFLFKRQAEGMAQPYMRPFTRALCALFVVIGAVTLLRNFGII